MMFPLVVDLAAEGVPVRLACGVLGFSAQAFYKWQKRPCSDRDWADAHAINAIVDVHADDPEFGYRFIADELEQAGQRSCERRVWRLCRQQRVWSTTTRKGRKHSGKTPGPAVHDDLVQRVFSAPAPDLVWLTDITEHLTLEGKLYCCSIKDVFSNRIVGYSIGDRMTADLAVSALRSAIARRQPDGTVVVHSDRGGQFRSRKFRATLKANRLTGSMGRVSSAADNAAMESFYALLQKNVLNRRRRWRTRAELRYELVVWIEHTYNNRRRQRALGRLTPVEFELAFTPPPACLEDDQAA
jgi:transposase InsO family protein